MKRIDENKARAFFQKEENDWQLVKQAAYLGDDQAAWCFRVMLLIENLIGNLWDKYGVECRKSETSREVEQSDSCRLILEKVDQVMMLRWRILYEDFRIQDKRQSIECKISDHLKKSFQVTHVQSN